MHNSGSRFSVLLHRVDKFFSTKDTRHCFVMKKVLKCFLYNREYVKIIRFLSREERYHFSVLYSLGLLSLFSGVGKAFSVLFYIKAIEYFCCFNEFLLGLTTNRVRFAFSSSTIVQIRLAKKNGMLLGQLRDRFDVKGAYLFESVSLLYMSIQILVPFLVIITSKNDKSVVLLPILNCKFGVTWFKIVSKSLNLIKLVLKRIKQSSKNRNQMSSKYLCTTKL